MQCWYLQWRVLCVLRDVDWAVLFVSKNIMIIGCVYGLYERIVSDVIYVFVGVLGVANGY